MSCHVLPFLCTWRGQRSVWITDFPFFSFSALASVKVSSNCFSAPSSNCFPAPAALRPLLPGFGTAPETVGDAANYWTRLSLFFSSLSLHFYYSFLPFFPSLILPISPLDAAALGRGIRPLGRKWIPPISHANTRTLYPDVLKHQYIDIFVSAFVIW